MCKKKDKKKVYGVWRLAALNLKADYLGLKKRNKLGIILSQEGCFQDKSFCQGILTLWSKR